MTDVWLLLGLQALVCLAIGLRLLDAPARSAIKWRVRQHRNRLWLRRHMRHPRTRLVGPIWRCSCGSTRAHRPGGAA